jgi:hypothetical protein
MIRTITALTGLLTILAAGAAEAQTWRTMESARQLRDREPTEVHIRYAAGELRVGAVEGAMLYEMEMRYDEENFRPLAEFDPDARHLHLGVEGARRRGRMDLEEGSRATIRLSREVPLDLDLDFGAGEAELELGGLRLRRLDVSTGASETTIRFGQPNPIQADRVSIEAGAAELDVIGLGNARARQIDFQGGVGSTTLDFTGSWAGNANASVQIGIGEVRLRFPRGLGVELRKRSFLSSFDGEGLVKRGNSYFSPDWETAAHRLTIDVNAAFGSIEVEWVG